MFLRVLPTSLPPLPIDGIALPREVCKVGYRVFQPLPEEPCLSSCSATLMKEQSESAYLWCREALVRQQSMVPQSDSQAAGHKVADEKQLHHLPREGHRSQKDTKVHAVYEQASPSITVRPRSVEKSLPLRWQMTWDGDTSGGQRMGGERLFGQFHCSPRWSLSTVLTLGTACTSEKTTCSASGSDACSALLGLGSCFRRSRRDGIPGTIGREAAIAAGPSAPPKMESYCLE